MEHQTPLMVTTVENSLENGLDLAKLGSEIKTCGHNDNIITLSLSKPDEDMNKLNNEFLEVMLIEDQKQLDPI